MALVEQPTQRKRLWLRLPDDLEFPRMALATLRLLPRQVNRAVALGDGALLEGLGEAEQGVGADEEEAA